MLNIYMYGFIIFMYGNTLNLKPMAWSSSGGRMGVLPPPSSMLAICSKTEGAAGDAQYDITCIRSPIRYKYAPA
jgi:hypothetical protein